MPQATVRHKRSWKRRALITFNVVLATLMVIGIGGLGFVKWQFGRIDKAALGPVLHEEDPGDPINVLLVGSDSRKNLSAEEQKHLGSEKDTPGLADTIMILHADPRAKRAAILSIPRDTYITIYSGTGKSLGKNKINSAFAGATLAGQQSLIKTIEMNFDIPINHFVQIDFMAFKDIVGAVNGVPTRFDAPTRDLKSGLNITQPGCVVLSGDQALAYARSRYHETFEGGKWHLDPRSDFSRIDRQQRFVQRVLGRAIDKGARNPIVLNDLINAGVKNVTLDNGFSLSEIAKVGQRFKSLDPGDVEMFTLPVSLGSTMIGGDRASIVNVEPQAPALIKQFLGAMPETPADIPNGSISVRVLNGSGVSGQASSASGALRDAGFVTAGTGDAKTFANASSTIRFAKGQRDKANVVAAYVGGPKQIVEDATLLGVDVVIITGSAFDGISAPGSTQPTTTSTSSSTTVAQSVQPSAAPDPSAC